MSNKMNGVMPVREASKIIGIQFSIMSPNEIMKSSVAEITSRDTFVNNKPVINGLFDPRMGVTEPGLICPTDGLDHMQTPGYHGHIKLARPVYYIQYFTTILKVLRCVCHNCSRLLINKAANSHLLDLSADERWNQVFKIASAVKVCGSESEDGCGYEQPTKIRKEGLATIVVEWPASKPNPDDEEGVVDDDAPKELIPEVVHKILRRITDDDVTFMGFNPIYSRPDWMICQVLAVPPPAVRPSVKQDAQQRSEDDLSHILVHIFKTNKTLMEKIQQNANANVIKDWHTYLQYNVASLIDNKQPGVDAVAQRSGRPHKSVKERLVGKPGRVRSNLMGKRVDYSARSVITPDPQLSIRELGIPLRIAMNLTKPVKVNERNIQFLTKLIQNGPDVWPGAKILQRKDGEIVLRHVDRNGIKLKNGDIVHRHMMDGDAVLFNRQPTLHRMSMMCHIARIMPVGDTFRMNVGDTKPYNADFDGDEMNLHMPQDDEAEAELRNLAAVPYQIISPGNNQSIIGIFQDSALGSYLITRENVKFNVRHAMNLLAAIPTFDTSIFSKANEDINSFRLLSEILPPLTMRYKTKAFDSDKDDFKTSNAVVEIVDGQYIRGQMTKEVLGSGSKGLIHRICNDFSNMSSAQMIDDLQNIVTEYMKTTAYSVGISDLIADKTTNMRITEEITKKKKEVQSLIDQTHLGVFENKTGRTNQAEFERQVTEIYLNKATNEAGKIGLKSLSKNNRFVIMVKAGSKGSELNISQMISCLGQQNVDGKRIPYGFENRTLPHFHKYDDSPTARGFVESSFIGGLTPQELFFHAMGGRMGLIDTAVKTSHTGYIQRRLIKGMEDIKVEYDMTVRNSKGKVVQFSYGDDNMETTKVESQVVPFLSMSIDDIYSHFTVQVSEGSCVFTRDIQRLVRSQKSEYNSWSKEMAGIILSAREEIVENVFNQRDIRTVNMPVAFQYIINNVIGQLSLNENSQVDISPYEAVNMIENNWNRMMKHAFNANTRILGAMYFYYMSPRDLLIVKRFNRKALQYLLDMIRVTYIKSIVAPGEMVGMIAAQSVGEPATQMTLNTFHLAGVATKSNVTRGVQRLEEILSISRELSNPSCTVYLNPDEETDNEKAIQVMQRIQHTRLRQVVSDIKICFDPDDLNTLIEQDSEVMEQYKYFTDLLDNCDGNVLDDNQSGVKSKWIVRMELDPEKMLDHGLSMDDIYFAIKNAYGDEISCTYNDYNSDKLIFRVRRIDSMSQVKKSSSKVNPLDQSDQIYLLKSFQDNLLDNLVLRGVKDIRHATIRKLTDKVEFKNGTYQKKTAWVVDTVGSNLMELMSLDYIDRYNVVTNDIREVYNVLGIEAARQAIYDEITDTLEFEGTYINYHHLSLLADRMTYKSTMTSIFRHGINSDDIGPIAKASFEETPEMFLRAARHAELDPMRGVSANVMCGQEGNFGTAAFQLMLDMDTMKDVIPTTEWKHMDVAGAIEAGFGELADSGDICSTQNIVTQTNVGRIKAKDSGQVANDYMPDF